MGRNAQVEKLSRQLAAQKDAFERVNRELTDNRLQLGEMEDMLTEIEQAWQLVKGVIEAAHALVESSAQAGESAVVDTLASVLPAVVIAGTQFNTLVQAVRALEAVAGCSISEDSTEHIA